MSFLIRYHWNKLNKEIWDSVEKSIVAPKDIYIELLRYISETHGFQTSDEALNDPKLAREEFRKFSAPPNEASCVAILEGFFDILSQFGTEIAQKYREKVDQYVKEHNLRYTLTPQCKLKLSLQGLLVTQHSALLHSLQDKEDRLECLNELESSLARISEEYGDNNCIRVASNLLEGLLNDRASTTGMTLGAALARCRDLFPYASLKECVENLYEFCCNYPNLRHAGTASMRVRPLRKDDALLIVALALGFSSFIANNDAGDLMLSGNL